jgi:hypothetical protein
MQQSVWVTMEYRHINFINNEWNVAAVHSIWERALEKNICALIREVKINAKASNAVRRAIPHSKVYGWPKFFRLYIEKIHGEK